jgi:hypothetical protein
MSNASIRFETGFLFTIISLLSLTVWAQEAPLVPVHDYGISANVSYFYYEEDTVDMEIDGPMIGIAGHYGFHNAYNPVMLGVQGELCYGSTDYDGAIQAGADRTPVTRDSDDIIVELRGLTGLYFEPEPDLLLTPYLGLGYRYWHNDIEGTGSYTREIQYFYLPVGLELTLRLNAKWCMRLTTEGDYLLSGKVDSELSDVLTGFNDTTNKTDAGDGWGARVSLEARTDDFSIGFYYKYWDIDESDTDTLTLYGTPIGLVVEPANTTTIFGIMVGCYF